jgi:hypothetical protein
MIDKLEGKIMGFHTRRICNLLELSLLANSPLAGAI